MADEKTEETVKPEAPPAKSETELPVAKVVEPQVVAPVPVKKLDPVDELGETLDRFFAGILSAGIRGMDSMAKEFKKKTDAVIEKLDVGDPPKKQD